MKIKAIRATRRRLANQRNNNNPPQQQNNENSDNQGQQAGNAQQRENVVEQKELKGWSLTLARTKELCICFVFSLFPAWNVENYIEEHRHLIIQNPQGNAQNNLQENAQPNNAEPNNDGANSAANPAQDAAETNVQNREQGSSSGDNLFEAQAAEERKERTEHEQRKDNIKEVELANLQRFESRDDTVRNDPLLD